MTEVRLASPSPGSCHDRAMGRSLRVIQWATGNIGSRSLRAVIDHPGLELVGVWVSNPDKVGLDAGALCGADPTGVTATDDVEAMVTLDADCVLYTRQGIDWDEVCALLASGKNISTTRGEFHHPPSMDPGRRDQVEAACAAGDSSIHSTGSSPGFITEALPVPLLSLARRLDCITIDEFADVSTRNSPEMIFRMMGFGAPVGPLDPRRAEHLAAGFGGSMRLLAESIGRPIDDIVAEGELSATRNDVEIAAGVVPGGTVGAMRTAITGMSQGAPVVRFRANWYVTTDIEDEGWNLRESGWRVTVEGDTPLSVEITFPVAPEDYAAFTPGLTAHRAVNAVPLVCAAPAGIRTTFDLPQIVPRFDAP